MSRLPGCLLACVLLGPCALFVGWNVSHFPERAALNDANRARAETIVTALREFRRESGSFPADLEALEPRYLEGLDALREPLQGLSYQVRETGFSLEFLDAPLGTLPGEAVHRYVSETGHWDSYLP